MNSQYLKTKIIPDLPGVYFFKQKAKILYVGRATSLKDRIKSYFVSDLINARGKIIVDMVKKADNIDFETTESVLEAIILEANLIKKLQPKYNTDEKDDKSFNYVIVTKEDFPRILVFRGREIKQKITALNLKIKMLFGPFPNSGALKESLKFIRKIFPYRDEKCKLKSEKPCFNFQIGLCPGTCISKISKSNYAKTIKNITTFFQGKKNVVLKNLQKEMKIFAKNLKFEQAEETRKKIFALNHIKDIAFIKKEEDIFYSTDGEYQKEKNERIEAYDTAHFSGKDARGVMIVLQNGEFKKSDYRIFKIKLAKESDDVGALKEILERRFKHKEWPFPDILVVDGGDVQFNIAQSVSKNFFIKSKIVSVVKDKRHKPLKILGEENLSSNYKSFILKANYEAHRFAISIHKKARKKTFLSKI